MNKANMENVKLTLCKKRQTKIINKLYDNYSLLCLISHLFSF